MLLRRQSTNLTKLRRRNRNTGRSRSVRRRRNVRRRPLPYSITQSRMSPASSLVCLERIPSLCGLGRVILWPIHFGPGGQDPSKTSPPPRRYPCICQWARDCGCTSNGFFNRRTPPFLAALPSCRVNRAYWRKAKRIGTISARWLIDCPVPFFNLEALE